MLARRIVTICKTARGAHFEATAAQGSHLCDFSVSALGYLLIGDEIPMNIDAAASFNVDTDISLKSRVNHVLQDEGTQMSQHVWS